MTHEITTYPHLQTFVSERTDEIVQQTGRCVHAIYAVNAFIAIEEGPQQIVVEVQDLDDNVPVACFFVDLLGWRVSCWEEYTFRRRIVYGLQEAEVQDGG